MKLVSWNVNGLRACMGKGFMDFSRKRMRIFSVFRRVSFRKGRFPWNCRDIISTGIMR